MRNTLGTEGLHGAVHHLECYHRPVQPRATERYIAASAPTLFAELPQLAEPTMTVALRIQPAASSQHPLDSCWITLRGCFPDLHCLVVGDPNAVGNLVRAFVYAVDVLLPHLECMLFCVHSPTEANPRDPPAQEVGKWCGHSFSVQIVCTRGNPWHFVEW